MEARLLVHRAPASFLLAVEEALTRSVGEGRSPPTIRVCIFDPPAVLIGFSQDVYEEVNVDEAARLGYDINRRPTGGGAIVMDRELTPGWEVWLPRSMLKHSSIDELYRELSRIPIEALRELGIDARFRPKNDIEVQGRKISGTGLYESHGAVMFCGTVLLDLDVSKMLRLLKIPLEKLSDKAIKEAGKRIITAREILGRVPTIQEVVEAFRKSFEKFIGAPVAVGELSDYERRLVEELISTRYGRREWVYEFRRASGFTRVCTYKTGGGLVRIHVKVVNDVLEQIVITGDFFAYPPTAVLDLESYIKHTPVDSVREEILEFFRMSGASIHGIDPETLATLIEKCLRGQ